MKTIIEGHKYLLDCHSQPDLYNKELQFYHAEGGEMMENGTTNEEVLRTLIDRLQFLQGKNSCRENAIVITKLEESLMWLEKRTKDRMERGVEGTDQK